MKRSYAVEHAPLGAGEAFVLGAAGEAGGFVDPTAGGAPMQDMYVGYRYAGEPWTLLPFFRGDVARPGIQALAAGRYGRTLGWATDRWMAQAMVFSIAHPFESFRDPATLDEARARLLFAPALYALLDFDNSHMEVPVELVFGLGDSGGPWGSFDDSAPAGMRGFVRGGFGFATREGGDVEMRQGADLFNDGSDSAAAGSKSEGRVECGLIFRLPAHGKAVFPVVLAMREGRWAGPASGSRMWHERYFESVEAVLAASLAQFDEARALAGRRDDELRSAIALGTEGQQMVASHTRNTLAGCRLVETAGGRSGWVSGMAGAKPALGFDCSLEAVVKSGGPVFL